jgi:hypothetical protein
MGMRKFVELCEKARRELGARFDIRRFHDSVLSVGFRAARCAREARGLVHRAGGEKAKAQ